MDIFRYRQHTDTHTMIFTHVHTQDSVTSPESVWKTLKKKRTRRGGGERRNERPPRRQVLSAPRCNNSEQSYEMLRSCVKKALYNMALLLRNCFHVRCDLEGEKTERRGSGREMGWDNTVTPIHTHTYTHWLSVTHVCVDIPNPFLRV